MYSVVLDPAISIQTLKSSSIITIAEEVRQGSGGRCKRGKAHSFIVPCKHGIRLLLRSCMSGLRVRGARSSFSNSFTICTVYIQFQVIITVKRLSHSLFRVTQFSSIKMNRLSIRRPHQSSLMSITIGGSLITVYSSSLSPVAST